MNYRDMVRRVAGTLGRTQVEVDAILRESFEQIRQALENGEEISIKGFGVFETRWVEPRISRSVLVGKLKDFPGYWRVRFRAAKVLKNQVRGSLLQKQESQKEWVCGE